MTGEEYKKQKESAYKRYQNELNTIHKQYANENNPHKVGDIVTDHVGSIRIEKIAYNIYSDVCTCHYIGIELKKDLTPTKNGNKRTVWQENLKK